MNVHPRAARPRRAPAAVIDIGVALVAALVICVTIAAAEEQAANDPDLAAYLLGAGIAVPLLVRRRWPVPVLIVSAAVLQLYYVADYPAIGVALPLAAATYTAVATGHLKAAIAVTGLLEVQAMIYRALAEGESLLSVVGLGTVADVALLAAVIALAEALRGRRALQAETRERLRVLRSEREREAERQAEQERMRIARELHDILAHTIAVINVQAGYAADVLGDDPEQARASLRAIRDESRAAIGEVKAALGVLRAEENGGGPRPPAPTLSDLDRLVATVNGTELAVEVSISGEARSLPPAVELTAYRIAQEALTNVVRHADAERATIALSYESDGLTIDVSDDGAGCPGRSGASSQQGYGIAGMRERVRAIGGNLEVGPLPDAGFRVVARLPAPRLAR